MEKFVIFYKHLGDYGYVYVDAKDFSEALAISSSFSRRTGCPYIVTGKQIGRAHV